VLCSGLLKYVSMVVIIHVTISLCKENRWAPELQGCQSFETEWYWEPRMQILLHPNLNHSSRGVAVEWRPLRTGAVESWELRVVDIGGCYPAMSMWWLGKCCSY
jgi:hypothetical protein